MADLKLRDEEEAELAEYARTAQHHSHLTGLFVGKAAASSG